VFLEDSAARDERPDGKREMRWATSRTGTGGSRAAATGRQRSTSRPPCAFGGRAAGRRAHTEVDACALGRARHGRGSAGHLPRSPARDRPSIDDGSTTTSSCAPADPDDLAAIEAGMRSSIAADHQFVRKEFRSRGRAFFDGRKQPFKVEILDDLATRARDSNTPLPPTSTYEHGTFIDLCKARTWPAPAGSARSSSVRCRRLLAWFGEAPDAAAHLRHSLAHAAGTGRLLTRREEAKKRDHRRLASSWTCSASTM